jgi:tetratricopeptide (TPR) repeat protein
MKKELLIMNTKMNRIRQLIKISIAGFVLLFIFPWNIYALTSEDLMQKYACIFEENKERIVMIWLSASYWEDVFKVKEVQAMLELSALEEKELEEERNLIRNELREHIVLLIFHGKENSSGNTKWFSQKKVEKKIRLISNDNSEKKPLRTKRLSKATQLMLDGMKIGLDSFGSGDSASIIFFDNLNSNGRFIVDETRTDELTIVYEKNKVFKWTTPFPTTDNSVVKTTSSGDPLYDQALEFIEQKKWHDAIEVLEKIERNRKYPSLYLQLGYCYSSIGYYEEALRIFKKGLELDLTDLMAAKIYNDMGLAYEGMGRYQDAKNSFKTALLYEPNIISAHFNLGLTYIHLGDRDSVFKTLEILDTIDTKYANRLREMIHQMLVERKRSNKK